MSHPPQTAVVAYEIVCGRARRRYIGITRCGGKPSEDALQKRLCNHINSAKNGATGFLMRAIRKYGPEKIKIRHIASAVSWESACELEKQLIKQGGTRAPNGYNLTEGGSGDGHFSRTDEYRKKISDRLTAWWSIPANREAWSKTRRERLANPEIRRKRLIAKRKSITPEYRAKCSRARHAYNARVKQASLMTGTHNAPA